MNDLWFNTAPRAVEKGAHCESEDLIEEKYITRRLKTQDTTGKNVSKLIKFGRAASGV